MFQAESVQVTLGGTELLASSKAHWAAARAGLGYRSFLINK